MSVVDEHIRILEEAIEKDSDGELEDAILDTVSVFSETIPGIKKGLDRYKMRVGGISSNYTPPKRIYDNKGDARKIIGKLRLYQECSTRDSEADKENDKLSQQIVVNANSTNNINASASSESSAYSSASFTSAMSCLWSIPDHELSASDKQEIAALLNALKEAEEDGSRPKIIESAKKAGVSILNKCIDHAPQLIAFVMQAIENASK